MLIWKKCGLDKFWPDNFPDCFRPFPTVSDRFIFSERLIGPNPFMEGWSSPNPCKPWRFIFFARPFCTYTAPNVASWPWYPIFPKIAKCQELAKINRMPYAAYQTSIRYLYLGKPVYFINIPCFLWAANIRIVPCVTWSISNGEWSSHHHSVFLK